MEKHQAKDARTTRWGRRAVRVAPTRAPEVVATSRSMPRRRLVNPSRTYAAAAPLLVAITETREAPRASFRSTPKRRVSMGTKTTPPPRPVRAPTKPPSTLPPKRRATNKAKSVVRAYPNPALAYLDPVVSPCPEVEPGTFAKGPSRRLGPSPGKARASCCSPTPTPEGGQLPSLDGASPAS